MSIAPESPDKDGDGIPDRVDICKHSDDHYECLLGAGLWPPWFGGEEKFRSIRTCRDLGEYKESLWQRQYHSNDFRKRVVRLSIPYRHPWVTLGEFLIEMGIIFGDLYLKATYDNSEDVYEKLCMSGIPLT